MPEEKEISQGRRPEARLYDFLREIYGELPAATRIEIDVEALSGGAHGTPHLEATCVRVYVGEEQLLPDFEGVPYWKEMLAAYPNLFQDCITHQDRLDTDWGKQQAFLSNRARLQNLATVAPPPHRRERTSPPDVVFRALHRLVPQHLSLFSLQQAAHHRSPSENHRGELLVVFLD